MHVVVFEGSRWPTFAPIALSRPVFALLSGTSTLLEKQVRHLRPTRLTLWVRPELAEHCRVRIVPTMPVPTRVNEPLDAEPAILVNGRMLMLGAFEPPGGPGVVVDDSETVRFAHTTSPGLAPSDLMNRTDRWLRLTELPRVAPQGRLVESLWDLIHANTESILADAAAWRDGRPRAAHPAGPYHLVRPEDVWLGDGVALEPGCVLDASKGPVILGDRVRVGANAVLQGPCYLGPDTIVTPLALVRAGTSAGPTCRLGGEVSNSVLLGYSNKAHEGFLGDSYLGKWVNFGSGTTTSNLKNTYGEISVKRGDAEVPTGRRFLGSLVGDHTKTATLTRLPTGAYAGFCANLAGSAIAPRFTPSYTFWSDKGTEPYRLEKAIEVTQRVYARRDRPWTPADERVMRYVAGVAPRAESGSERPAHA